MHKKITLYTDGGCRGNPGIGGWGCLLKYEGEVKELYGSEKHTTNNRMELTAVIQGLQQLKQPCEVLLISDSKYVCDGIEKWLSNWIKKNWLTASKKPVLNKDLWQQLSQLLETHQVTCQWVKGHNGHPENEQADILANQAMDKLELE
jgi:ribonuclease HI